MKCACKMVEKESREYICDSDWASIAIERNKWNEYYLLVIGDETAKMLINYCPLCGRKLRGE